MTLLEEAFMMLEQLKGRDERTDELVEEAIKRIQADVDALMFEAAELERLVVNQTSEREDARIRDTDRNRTHTWVGTTRPDPGFNHETAKYDR